MTEETINFFNTGKGYFGTPEEFESSWLYSYFTDLYGEMVFLPNIELEFIKVTEDGHYIDEIYCPDTSGACKAGTFIPKSFIGNKKPCDYAIWKALKEDGYYIAHYDSHPTVKAKVLAIPFNSNPELPSSILSTNDEDLHYMVLGISKYAGPLRLNKRIINTDALKYIYNPKDKSELGPYSFHMDYTPGVFYMFFNYHSESHTIAGRELVIGERDLTTVELDRKGLCRSGKIIKETKLGIKDDMVVFINTYNPKFVHRVEKLKADQSVITLTSYVHT